MKQILYFPPLPHPPPPPLPRKGMNSPWNSRPQDAIAEAISVFQNGVEKYTIETAVVWDGWALSVECNFYVKDP